MPIYYLMSLLDVGRESASPPVASQSVIAARPWSRHSGPAMSPGLGPGHGSRPPKGYPPTDSPPTPTTRHSTSQR